MISSASSKIVRKRISYCSLNPLQACIFSLNLKKHAPGLPSDKKCRPMVTMENSMPLPPRLNSVIGGRGQYSEIIFFIFLPKQFTCKLQPFLRLTQQLEVISLLSLEQGDTNRN